jgi:hypothetical protein
MAKKNLSFRLDVGDEFHVIIERMIPRYNLLTSILQLSVLSFCLSFHQLVDHKKSDFISQFKTIPNILEGKVLFVRASEPDILWIPEKKIYLMVFEGRIPRIPDDRNHWGIFAASSTDGKFWKYLRGGLPIVTTDLVDNMYKL